MQRLFKVIASLLIAYAAAAIGSLATIPNIPSWYAGLHKPFFSPPNWLFGPVWTVLYALIGVSLYLLWVAPAQPAKRQAYYLFFSQLVLNAAWSVVFFGLHLPWPAFVVILALLASIVGYIARVRLVNRWAAWLLLPYVAWVAFASALNAGVAALN